MIISDFKCLQITSALLSLLLLVACGSGEGGESETEQALPVSVAHVDVGTVVETERSMARSEAFSNPVISSEVGGQVLEILHDIGDQIEAGTVLAVLDQEPYKLQLSAAQADAAALNARLDQYQRDLDRLIRAGQGLYVSESDLEAARSDVTATTEELAAAESRLAGMRRELDRTHIRAPIDGRIDERMISQGDYISAGDAAFGMVPDASARVSLSFPESVGDRLEVGMTARLRRLNRDEDWVDGHLTRIRPSVEGGMGAVAVVEFEPPEAWRAGTMLEGLIEIDRRDSALLVPSESVVDRPAGKVVFVLPGDVDHGRVEERAVRLGYRTPDQTEILEGVEGGERIIVDGADFLSDDAPARVVSRN